MLRNRKGRVLKVKLGYNANSSSLAAIVTYFLWGAAASVLIINMVSAALASKNNGPNKDNKEKDESKNSTL
jgi:hypothetical protein